MNFQKQTNPLSGKMKLAITISVLWFLFWVIIGWEGESIFGGLAFGGIPLVIAWGFWLIAVQSRKDTDAMDRVQDILHDGTSGKREFVRLVYPSTNRPSFKYGEHELEIIDISEKGIKLLNERQLNLGKLIHGEAILLSGRSVQVDGEIAWSLNNEVGLLMALIPSSIIHEERRILSDKER